MYKVLSKPRNNAKLSAKQHERDTETRESRCFQCKQVRHDE